MHQKDTFEFEILDDGKISVKTGSFSGEVHKDADDFLAMLEDLVGGGRETESLRKRKHHHHTSVKRKAVQR